MTSGNPNHIPRPTCCALTLAFGAWTYEIWEDAEYSIYKRRLSEDLKEWREGALSLRRNRGPGGGNSCARALRQEGSRQGGAVGPCVSPTLTAVGPLQVQHQRKM